MIRWWSVALIATLGAPPPKPVYEAYAIRYATLADFPLRALVLGADSAATADIAMMVWLLKGEGRVMLVDAGFYRQEFLDAWKQLRDFVKPSDAVARAGVTPDQVTDIVVSHLHWDHADGVDLFPKARVWVQRREFEFYLDSVNQRRTGVFPVDIAMLKRVQAAGRLRLVEGDSQAVAPGVFVYTGGRHTKESQYVSAPIEGATAVIASDNLYLYQNLDRRRPIAATWDTTSNLAAQERMLRLAGGPRLVVPGHDALVFTRFREVVPGVARIR